MRPSNTAFRMSQHPLLQPVNPSFSNNKPTDRYLTSESSEFMSPLAAPRPLGVPAQEPEVEEHCILFPPCFPAPEHTCKDKSLLIQRWDEWQHCVYMCAYEQEGGQAGTPGATQRSTKTGSVLLAVTHGQRIKIYAAWRKIKQRRNYRVHMSEMFAFS